MFLRPSEVIDSDHPSIVSLARELSVAGDKVAVAKASFEWVRDQVMHSRDYEQDSVTWRASDVLRHRTGYCYAKSHLLGSLLRANGIPAGFCYQRLSVNDSGPPYSLHGYVAMQLPRLGWYRVDPRGNRKGIDARFDPPRERLAFPLQSPDEVEFENVLVEPLVCVVDSLKSSGTWREALANLPDVSPEEFGALGLVVRRSGPHTYQ